MRYHHGFNEATAVRPWKADGETGSRRGIVLASMRPRLLGRGRTRTAAMVAQSAWGFNEATAVRPWKAGSCRPTPLPWKASMRPRLLGRGRITLFAGQTGAGKCFNEATAVRPWKAFTWIYAVIDDELQ